MLSAEIIKFISRCSSLDTFARITREKLASLRIENRVCIRSRQLIASPETHRYNKAILSQRRRQRSRLWYSREMVGRHGVLESSLLHARQETGRAGRGSHKGGRRWYLSMSGRLPNRPNAKLQSQFNGDR